MTAEDLLELVEALEPRRRFRDPGQREAAFVVRDHLLAVLPDLRRGLLRLLPPAADFAAVLGVRSAGRPAEGGAYLALSRAVREQAAELDDQAAELLLIAVRIACPPVAPAGRPAALIADLAAELRRRGGELGRAVAAVPAGVVVPEELVARWLARVEGIGDRGRDDDQADDDLNEVWAPPAEVAAVLGRDPRTLTRWERDGAPGTLARRRPVVATVVWALEAGKVKRAELDLEQLDPVRRLMVETRLASSVQVASFAEAAAGMKAGGGARGMSVR